MYKENLKEENLIRGQGKEGETEEKKVSYPSKNQKKKAVPYSVPPSPLEQKQEESKKRRKEMNKTNQKKGRKEGRECRN